MALFDGLADLDPATLHVLEEMIGFAEAAGHLALDLRAEGLAVTHKGDDLGDALTQADTAISRMMAHTFGPRLVEEETATRLSFADCRAILAGEDWSYIGDPIDGTRAFAGGLSTWGTMLAACRSGWPVASVMSLPAWADRRDRPHGPSQPDETTGLLLASAGGTNFWAPTRGGRISAPLARLHRTGIPTHHVGWMPAAVRNFAFDYRPGYFPYGESACISDFASLLTGRLDASTFASALWDLAPAVPAFEAAGFRLFAWPDLQLAPHHIIDMFDADFYLWGRLWMIARDEDQAARIGRAIRRAPPLP